MTIFLRGKSKYIISPLDGKDYNVTTGHLARYLASINIPIEDFLVNHLNVIRDVCNCCGKPAALKGTEDLHWKWWTTCGNKQCAIELRRRGRQAVTKEQEAESVRKRNKTFADNPELLKNRSKLAHEANLIVGEDGLTGYERTAKKRATTLEKKYGRADYANWDKSKQTWAEKSHDDKKQHGEKITQSWARKSDDVKKLEIEKREAAKLQKYGIPGWKIAFNGSRGRRSKLADTFCKSIQNLYALPLIFGQTELNIDTRYFDLVCQAKKRIIEFNGDYWHANPTKYGSEAVISMKGGRTAAQIWEADAAKIALAKQHGYDVKVVWESDYKKNPEKTITECIEWLNS